MSQTPIGDPALRDPMFRDLRRRHPEVTIVMLPQRPVPLDMPQPVPLAEACALEERTRGALGQLVEAAGVEPAGVAALWWRQGPDGSHRFVTRATFMNLVVPVAVMRAMYDHLEDAGWHVRAMSDPRPRFDGEHGPLRVRVDAYPTAVQVQVTSEPIVLDAVTLADLERGA